MGQGGGLNCRACGTANETGRKFCAACGSRLVETCPSCGTANAPTDRFCGECGAALGSAPATAGSAVTGSAPVADARTAERRMVTILFADLVGFTSLAEDRDPETVRELLTRYFEVAADVIGRYGGTVEKFIGDAVMAVWGAPTAHEDDAERAVRAGLELIEAVRGLAIAERPLEVRAGILSGEAAVTVGAVGQGMVAGDLVNTASRLQSVAPSGTVLVGESTYRATSEAIAFEPAGDHLLKGKASPVPAWRAIRVVGMIGGAGRSDVLEPPFVGREAELRLVKELLHAATRERRLRLVSVIGQPGIGKSRLAWEFHKYIDGISEPIYWHQGRSPAYGEGITFWALGEMVRKRAGLIETDDATTTRARIAESLLAHVPDESERRWIEPRLLQLLGVDEGSGGDRDELFAAWRTFFERVSEQGTVVLVFEDLQWADTGLLDFIDHLVEWSRGRPILVMTMARPELLERRPGWGAGRRNFVSLSLEPLTREDMAKLLEGLVPGLPDAMVLAILERADGIPLYAVETIRMLLHDGQVEAVDGIYRPVSDQIRLDVPETLHALIAARLDGLDAADRSLLQDAAVLGQTFSVGALAAVCGQEPQAVIAHLRVLERRELVAEEIDPRSPERGQWAFVQALIREVGYATLSKRDRRARHLSAARYVEGLGDDELAGVQALHYRDAYLAMPEGPEGEAVAVQARLALRGAAERASALHSNDLALTYLEQALSITPDSAEDPELLERAGNAAFEAGRHDAAETHLTHAIERYGAIGERVGLLRATASLGASYVSGSQVVPAIATLRAATEEYPELEDEPAMVSVGGQLARAYMLHEEPQVALEWAERTLVAAERLDMVTEVAEAMNTKALVLQILGRFIEATTTLRGVLWLAEQHGLTQAELRAYNNLSFLLVTADPRTGLEVAQTGIERASKVGARQWVTLLASNAATASLRVGDWATAEALIDTWLEASSDWVSRIELGSVGVVMAACRAAPGDEPAREFDAGESDSSDPQIAAVERITRAWVGLCEGRDTDSIADAMAAAAHATGYAVMAYPLAMRAAVWSGDASRSAAAISAFEALSIHGAAVEATRHGMRSGMAALQGRHQEAVDHAVEALERWWNLGARFEYALAVIDASVAAGASQPWLAQHAATARSILEELGAQALLDRWGRVAPAVPAPAPDETRSVQAVQRSDAATRR
jgi:class 3 adenylate cyclase/tetratricopeptide (TPR) repeat protein